MCHRELFATGPIKDHNYGRNYNECLAHNLMITIAANGDVDLCCCFKEQGTHVFGNINLKRLKDIWKSKQRKDVISQIDVHKCPPLCKGHEMNKIFNFVKNYKKHKGFL